MKILIQIIYQLKKLIYPAGIYSIKQEVTLLNKIIFKDARVTRPQDNQIEQIKNLFPVISPVKKGDIVAIKIHPGEYGNTTHVRPVVVRTIVDMVLKEGGIPFVTDTTTLYTEEGMEKK